MLHLAAIVSLLCSGALYGQRRTGEIRLEVKDPSGAAMEASGKLEGLAIGVNRGFHTDVQGRYAFHSLPYGQYRLEISRDRFATQSVSIDVESEAPVSRIISMALSASAFKVDVVGTTPLPGVDLSPKEIPAPVQTGNERDIANSGALELSDYLNRRLDGVYLNEVQGNPF